MNVTLSSIAEFLNAEYEGDGNTLISGIQSIDKAQKQDVTFLSKPKFADKLQACQAAVVILQNEYKECFSGNKILMQDPYVGYAKLTHFFADLTSNVPNAVHHARAVISASASIGENVSIGAHVVIEDNVVIGDNTCIYAGAFIGKDVSIGSNVTIYANVNIYHGVCIGNDSIIHAGAVIGSDGFGFANENGHWIKILQLGTVIIGNKVEIGANTTIDRGALDNTIIEDNVIIDNLCQIAHNVSIGFGTAIAGCAVIAGSTEIGKFCIIGGRTAIAGHIKIADQVTFTAGTRVSKSILSKGVYSSGSPIMENHAWKKNSVRIRHLDQMYRKLMKLLKLTKNVND